MIDYIHNYTESQAIEALPHPWLLPLPERIVAEDLDEMVFSDSWREPKQPLAVTIGMADQPELQAQSPLTLDLTKDGHIGIFGSPGYAKSTFLQKLIMNLTRQHNPEHLHIYLLDFGINGLLPLKDLPSLLFVYLSCLMVTQYVIKNKKRSNFIMHTISTVYIMILFFIVFKENLNL